MGNRRNRQRGKAYLRAGEHKQAAKCFERALAEFPGDVRCWTELGRSRLALGDNEGAEQAFKEAISRGPPSDKNAIEIAQHLIQAGKPGLAETSYRKTLDQGGRESPQLWAKLGRAYYDRGDTDRAIAALQRAAHLDPNDVAITYNLAIALEPRAERHEIESLFRHCVDKEPLFFEAYQRLAHVTRFERPTDPLIARMAEIATDESVSAYDRERIDFALAKAYDDCGIYNSAWRHLQRANAAKRQRRPAFSHTTYFQALAQVCSFFRADKIKRLACDALDDGPRPIFIVGLPRSGTTLVERQLASHPEVAAGGERPDIQQAVSSQLQPFPATLEQEPGATVRALRREYQLKTRALGGSNLLVTDKMPGNVFYLGLIRMVFPEAIIVHCRRNALDTCLSIYFQDFDKNHEFANDLEDLSAYYQGYRSLVAHWRDQLPGLALELWYEEVVKNPEATRKKLWAYCGLPQSPATINDNLPVADTASLWQVREPVYTRSVRRWRNYAEFLGDLPDRLRTA